MVNAWSWMAVAGLVWLCAVILNRRTVREHHGRGDPREGIVLFVEPVRWLFVIWGFASFCRGLRRGGWRGQTRLFRWSTAAGSLLVVPDVVSQKRLRRRAARLARLVEQLSTQHPGVPVHLCGYSSGCYVVMESLRQLEHTRVSNVFLLAATISPDYAIESTGDRAARIEHVYSPLDVINLLGPMVIGTNDRRWRPACGSVGFLGAHPTLVQRRWRWRDVTRLYFGDHFTVVSARFVSEYLSPLIAGSARI